jgi:hypothetical protein
MRQRDRFRISGKDLGVLALPGFCARCFWLRRSAPHGIPFQIFPGIFSSIDSYTKRVVHGWFDKRGKAPEWLSVIRDVVTYRDAPHHSRFWVDDPLSGIRLTGAPDGVLVRTDQSIVIVDYKTARYTEGQDELLPVYETQLNAYAFIAERQGMGTVSALALVYAEPITTEDAAVDDGVHVANGFRLRFSIRIVDVPVRVDSIPPLLARARQILDLNRPPNGCDGCDNCEKTRGLLALAGLDAG